MVVVVVIVVNVIVEVVVVFIVEMKSCYIRVGWQLIVVFIVSDLPIASFRASTNFRPFVTDVRHFC